MQRPYSIDKRILMLSKGLVAAFFFTSIVSMTLSGCSHTGTTKEPEQDPDAIEIKPEKQTKLDLPEKELFDYACHNYELGMYSLAREHFESLRDNYPTGAYAEYAEIKIADSKFEDGDYPAAAIAYEEFTKGHPASSSLPYMLMRAGRSFQLSSKGTGRDSTPLNKATETFSRFVIQYPMSVYAPAVRAYNKEVQDKLAAQAKAVIDFYRKKNKQTALATRESEFAKRWGKPSSEFSPETEKEVLSNVHLLKVSENRLEEARTAITRTTELPSSTGVVGDQTSFSVKTESDLTQQGTGVGPTTNQPTDLPTSAISARGVSCTPEKGLIFILLSAPYSGEIPPVAEAAAASQSTGKFVVSLPGLLPFGSVESDYDCFSSNDLIIAIDGRIELKHPISGADMIVLDNPPRVLIAVRDIDVTKE